MHADQAELPVAVVARLAAEQFPQWQDRELHPVASTGTVNALFRLGEDVVLRFPLQPRTDEAMLESLTKEQDNARRIAGATRLEVPEPLGIGRPGEGYAGWWTAYRWIDGATAGDENVHDQVRFAEDLAQLVLALQAMDVAGRSWDGHSRGGPLSTRSAGVRQALAQSTELTDVPALTRVWERCLAAGRGDQPDVWLHGDLMPGNLLVRDGRLAAVIDCETVCVGDPAVDLIPAWNLMTATGRSAYRRALAVDDATWERGRGWAIAQAIVALPYYVDSNPVMASTARRTLVAVLE